jgi:hypothetical protein
VSVTLEIPLVDGQDWTEACAARNAFRALIASWLTRRPLCFSSGSPLVVVANVHSSASTKAGGAGLNLYGADTVIFIDSDFNPQVWAHMFVVDKVIFRVERSPSCCSSTPHWPD